MGGRSQDKGFSLLEILIVVAVVSIGLLGTMSVYFWGLRAGSEGARMTEAINISREILEVIRVRNLAFSSGANITTDSNLLGNHPLDHPPLDDLALPAEDETSFRREVSITRLGTSGYEARVARILVSTVWQVQARTKKVTIEGYASVQ